MTKTIQISNPENIKLAAQIICDGGLVIFPSDTVYGLLADARNPKAIDKLLEFKTRPTGKAISVFVSDKKMATKYVYLNPNALNIVKNLLPGPFTVICRSKHQTDVRLEAENGTLGFRIPAFPLINQLTTQLAFPITATSANVSGTPYHYSVDSLVKILSKKKLNTIDLIIDAGELPHNLPSTVIDTTTADIKTLRQGDLLPDTSLRGSQSTNTVISQSENDTFNIGRFIGNKHKNKTNRKLLVLLLNGELGVGKTILVKGLAASFGITDTITSPTYNIVNEYPIVYKSTKANRSIPQYLVHFDLYRLNTPKEVAEIGLFDYISAENVIAIEWPERLGTTDLRKLSQNSLVININIEHRTTTSRKIKINSSKHI